MKFDVIHLKNACDVYLVRPKDVKRVNNKNSFVDLYPNGFVYTCAYNVYDTKNILRRNVLW